MIATLVSFLLVFFKILQTKNIIHNYILPAMVMSYLITAAEVLNIIFVVNFGLPMIFFIGTGGMFGVLMAIKLHDKVLTSIFKRRI